MPASIEPQFIIKFDSSYLFPGNDAAPVENRGPLAWHAAAARLRDTEIQADEATIG
jgi:hypothetical protein